MNVTVYVEGGGNVRATKKRCRQGFSALFRKAGLSGRMPRVFAAGGRADAWHDFRTALAEAGENDFIVLLVDSEAPVRDDGTPWVHLREQDRWNRPDGAAEENAHLMVQCMESWFLADMDALAGFFGDGFNRGALPRRPDIENVSKCDVERGLKRATRRSGKGEYHKGRHSFEILAELAPGRVIAASPHAKRFVDTLLKMSS